MATATAMATVTGTVMAEELFVLMLFADLISLFEILGECRW
jgi:hypothetical protein